MRIINHESLEKTGAGNIERAALWDIKDSFHVMKYIRQLQDIKREIAHCRTRYPEMYRQLKAVKHKMMSDYDGLIDRIWNDQKSGTYFIRSGTKFEPHQVVRARNLVTWDGLAMFTGLIAQDTDESPNFMVIGTGTSEATFGDQELEIEVARIDIQILGDLSAEGTVLKFTGAFPTGIPNAVISEFGASDSGSGIDEGVGVLAYRTVIENTNDMLSHIQNRTIIQSSHSIEFVAVENKIE